MRKFIFGTKTHFLRKICYYRQKLKTQDFESKVCSPYQVYVDLEQPRSESTIRIWLELKMAYANMSEDMPLGTKIYAIFVTIPSALSGKIESTETYYMLYMQIDSTLRSGFFRTTRSVTDF